MGYAVQKSNQYKLRLDGQDKLMKGQTNRWKIGHQYAGAMEMVLEVFCTVILVSKLASSILLSSLITFLHHGLMF